MPIRLIKTTKLLAVRAPHSRISASKTSFRSHTLCLQAQAHRFSTSISRPAGRLEDKICIVTGSSSGLGRSIAVTFAREGARLVVCSDLSPAANSTFNAEEAGTSTHELIQKRYGGSRAVFQKTDVTAASEVEALVQLAVARGGRLDVMANNAGIGGTEGQAQVHELSEKIWDDTMAVNAKSVFLGCKYAIAQFLSQPPHTSCTGREIRGSIINTASIMGLVGQKINGAAYCASKGAVVQLTRSTAVAFAEKGINCNALCPGHLKTPMTEPQYKDPEMRKLVSNLYPDPRDFGSAEDVANVAAFLASDEASYVTGVPMPVDGGYVAQ